MKRIDTTDKFGNTQVEVIRDGAVSDMATVIQYGPRTFSVNIVGHGFMGRNFTSVSRAADAAWEEMSAKYNRSEG